MGTKNNPGAFDDAMRALIDKQVADGVRARIRRNVVKHAAVLNRLESHLGCVICRGPLTDGRCPKCQAVDAS